MSNVTRTITTRSEAWQKGDTSVVIQTKTIETYDTKKERLLQQKVQTVGDIGIGCAGIEIEEKFLIDDLPIL